MMINNVFTLLSNDAMSYQQEMRNMSKTVDLGVANEKFVMNVYYIL